ncbi:hypothetical protein C2845_PM08G29980 [Panicum miliaceum]|uniref:Isopenicillin N synthase-like Fe(2+) 2OG dioxygenase domain-containing protein n=1 Tax=Panicum miliaceum TaxID=4540 RepID=A0A3L6R1Y1_PANMI|nr:hypothetical protein C2845_PM08G29980 [Panicum miliaceum]
MASSSSTAAAATATAMSRTASGGSALPGPPPPTPSNHHAGPSSAAAGGTDAALSAFLHRLLLSSPAPQLRSPLAARSRASPSLPPLVSLEAPDHSAVRDAADVGYFHLVGHGLPSELPSSALAQLSQIDASSRRESNLRALGFSEEEEEEEEQDPDGGADDHAVVFDACEGDMDALPAAAEYARRMRDVGMRVVALLSGYPDAGFREEPFAEGRRKARCLVWASKVSTGDTAPPAAGKAKAYPYVVGLHCQWEASGKEAAPASWVMNDGGEWVAVGARDGALLVTIGDIAQVWSNGKLKKVRGMARPTSAPMDTQHGETDRLSLTVLITLSLDNIISPLVPLSNAAREGEDDRDDEANGAGADGDGWRFHSFLLEDYAWWVYHQRLQFKDPLVRYRI